MSNLSFVAAADTTNLQAGGKSFFDSASDMLTKGVAGAVVSGLHGILNTGVDLSNKVFGTTIERADTVESLSKLDESYAQYYTEHKETIDVAGFVAGSLIPGGLAIKGLKAVQRGESAGAFGRVLGYTTRMENKYLNQALAELAQEGGTVFTRISAAKSASMAWGVADNVLQMAAFETAVAMTMKASPILDDKDWKAISSDIVKTALIGGAIGGGVNAIFTQKLVKDAGKLVEGKQREYDILKATGDVNVAFGDKAYSIVNAVLGLPDEILDPVVKLAHGRKGLKDSLNIGPLLEKTKSDTIDRGLLKFEKALADVNMTDKTIGLSLAKSFITIAKDGLAANKSKEVIGAKLGDLLFNLRSVEGIGNRPLNVAGDVIFHNPQEQLIGREIGTAIKGKGEPYRVVGDRSQATMATLGKDANNLEAAWQKGFDTAFDPASGTVKVSPYSKIYTKLDEKEAEFAPMFYNTLTKQTSYDTVPTIADIQTAGVPLVVNAGGVASGKRTFPFSTGILNTPVDAVEATARHLWASKLSKVFGQIDADDISVLEAIAKNRDIAIPDLTIIDRVTGVVTPLRSLSTSELGTFIFKRKREQAMALIEKAGERADMRDIAYRLNVEGSWLENGVASRFESKALYNDGGWLRDTAAYSERENLLFRYEKTGDAATNFPDALTSYYTRVKDAQSRTNDVADAALGTHAKLLPDIRESLAGDATSQTVGASFVGASNANYSERLKAAFQYIGQQVGQIKNERVTAALSKLQSPMAKLLQNPAASTEVTAALAAARLAPKDPVTGSVISWAVYENPRALKAADRWMLVDLESFNQIKSGGAIAFKRRIALSEDAGNFFDTFQKVHAARLDQYNPLYAAQGVTTKYDPARLHLPPVDTQRVPFFAFVRQSDGTMFGSSEIAMITARDAGELQKKAAQIEAIPGLKIQYKDGSEAYHKAKRDYEHGMTMNNTTIDSTLRSKGLLGDYLPNFTPEAVMEDFVQYTQRAEGKLVNDLVEAKYGQTFAELQDLSDRYTAVQTSKFEGLSKLLQRGVTDPFGDAIKLALNISKRSEFTLWNEANEFVDALGVKAFRGIEAAALDAKGSKITWQEANRKLEDFGVAGAFRDEDAFLAVQSAQDRNLIKTALHKANMLIATGTLRLDFANSLLNVVSTPVMLGMEVSSIRNSLKKDPELFAAFNKSMQQQVPGTELFIPSTTKLLANAVADLARANSRDPLMQRFKDIGTVKGQVAIFHDMVDDLSLTPKIIPSEYAAKVDRWVEKGASITFNNQAEDATRFVSSHVMMQITDPLVKLGKMTTQEQNAYMSIFTNRVQGNYIAAQRPMLFQGTIGSAIGLFQTYQFNMFQQLFRHIENKDMKTIAVAGALQGTLFGANGLPFFQAINSHIVGSASINAGHKDAYSFATQAVGKEWGDWLMYGTASAMPLFSDQSPALWTRGDLNPRGAFLVPTSPMDVPAVQVSLKVVNAVLGMASQIGKGVGVQDALLFGLEHNGINRPLAGLAQVLSGNVTTSKGNLIAAAGDWDSIATASRLLGAKPMDESIALTTMYRSSAYQAMDKERIDALGTVVKMKARNNEPITPEDWIDLQGKYAASGGRIQGFGAAMRRWDKASNTSLVDEMMRHSQTAAGQRLNEAMGGDPLADYRANIEAP